MVMDHSKQKNFTARKSDAPKTRAEFRPKPVTPQYLDNAAAYYLQRFSASAEKLRQILTQKAKRRVGRDGEVPAETAAWIAELIEKYIARGWLNDEAYATAQVRNLRGRGSSARQIAMKLQQKGVNREQISAALAAHAESSLSPCGREPAPDLIRGWQAEGLTGEGLGADFDNNPSPASLRSAPSPARGEGENDHDPELRAAIRYLQRRRLGPWRTREVENARDKDLAALMRQGFSLDIARQALVADKST